MFKILVASLAFTGCMNHGISGGTENYVETNSEIDGEVRIVLEIDVTACEGLPQDTQLECIRAFLDTFKELKDLTTYIKAQGEAKQ